VICQCGRALAPCEWCGTADILPSGEPVIIRPGWVGAWHERCRALYEKALSHAV